MNELWQLQKNFFLNCKPGSDTTDSFYQNFIGSKALVEERLAIYRQSIYLSLQQALSSIYPHTAKLLTEEIFNQLTEQFLAKQLPTCSDLNYFGSQFPCFLQEKISLHDWPVYIADLATLEWAWHESIFHYNNPLIKSEDWQQCLREKGDQIILLPPKESSWIISAYPLHLVWQKGYDATLEQHNQLFYFLIWQKAGVRCMEVLTSDAYLLLNGLSAEKTLLDVCAEITNEVDIVNFPVLLNKLVRLSCLYLYNF